MSSKGKIIDLGIEALFAKICRARPAKSALEKLKQYPDQEALSRFIIGKMEEAADHIDRKERIKMSLEWGLIHFCRGSVLRKTSRTAEALLNLLEALSIPFMSGLYDEIMMALENFGPAALESVWWRYQRNRFSRLQLEKWMWVMAGLGVRDKRINMALKDYALVDPGLAASLMGIYGDPEMTPLVEDYVIKVAEYLNRNRINPFTRGPVRDFFVYEYLDARESLIMLRHGHSVADPDFGRRVEELDRQLLKYADFSVFETPCEDLEGPFAGLKIGRNDPCPCGSGKKYKLCCGK